MIILHDEAENTLNFDIFAVKRLTPQKCGYIIGYIVKVHRMVHNDDVPSALFLVLPNSVTKYLFRVSYYCLLARF